LQNVAFILPVVLQMGIVQPPKFCDIVASYIIPRLGGFLSNLTNFIEFPGGYEPFAFGRLISGEFQQELVQKHQLYIAWPLGHEKTPPVR